MTIKQKAEELWKKADKYVVTTGNNDCTIDAYIAGYSECQKEHEWHYVKDGDLPKDENYVLVSNGKDWTKGFYKDKKWNIISLVGFTKIIAWKEIDLMSLVEKRDHDDKLAKAKELLEKMYYLYFEPCVTHKDLENRDKLFEEVKQFIKE